MPPTHTVFCTADRLIDKLNGKSDAYYVPPLLLMDVIIAQAACINVLNDRLHKLESHPSRVMGD